MRKLFVIVFIIFSLLLVSCTSGQNFDNSASELDKYAILKTTDEVTESDFVYHLDNNPFVFPAESDFTLISNVSNHNPKIGEEFEVSRSPSKLIRIQLQNWSFT